MTPIKTSMQITTSALSYPSSGPLVIPMTNDYLFRALLQRNNKVLKGLICSLLHLAPEEVYTAEITNPIELGTSFTDKTFILDVRVCLNNLTIINLELQVINQHNWVERSLSYLCRNFDHLQAGQNYLDARPVMQIGLLNYTLFPEYPEFYAAYQLLNVKNYSKYSDKLQLFVLDLTQTELATEEDKLYRLNSWASLFKAVTWEEINMLAQENESIREAAETVYQLTQEERIRMECEAREDYYRTQRDIQSLMDRQIAENDALLQKTKALLDERDTLTEQNSSLADENNTLADRNNTLADQNNALADRNNALADQNNALADRNNALADQNNALTVRNNALADQNNALTDRNNALADQNNALADRNNALADQNNALTDRNNTLADQNNALTDQNNALADRNNTLADQNNALTDQNNALADQNNALTDQNNALTDRNNALAQANKELEDKLSKLLHWAEAHGFNPDEF